MAVAVRRSTVKNQKYISNVTSLRRKVHAERERERAGGIKANQKGGRRKKVIC